MRSSMRERTDSSRASTSACSLSLTSRAAHPAVLRPSTNCIFSISMQISESSSEFRIPPILIIIEVLGLGGEVPKDTACVTRIGMTHRAADQPSVALNHVEERHDIQ